VTVLGLCLWAGKGLGDGFWADKKLTNKPSHEVFGNDYRTPVFLARLPPLLAFLRAHAFAFFSPAFYVSESCACSGLRCAVGGETLKCAATEASKEVRP
jgi:hypothetical protein